VKRSTTCPGGPFLFTQIRLATLPKLRRIQYFSCEAPRLQTWLQTIPGRVDLADADEILVEGVARLPEHSTDNWDSRFFRR